jgi:hypothetical protein
MDFSSAVLFAIAALLGANQVVFRIPGWEHRRIVFWGVQLLNLCAAVMVLIWGLPGFEQTVAEAVKWVLGLLLVLHIITNNQRLVRALQDGSSGPEVDAKRSRIKAALAAASARAEE